MANPDRSWRGIVRAAALLSVLLVAASMDARARAEEKAPTGKAAKLFALHLKFAQALRGEVLRPDNCPYDPSAAVMWVGPDPKVLARFVREQIAYEPYPGLVRGPEGTLAAWAGSDWDRAALLRALLAEAGFKSRLRLITRTDAERAAVVDQFLKQDALPRTLYAAGSGSALKLPPASPLLKRFKVSEKSRRALAARAVAQWRRLLNEAYDAAAREGPWIEQAVAKAGGAPKVGQPFAAWRKGLLAGTAERVVVELLGRDGGQLLDTGPDARPLAVDRLPESKALDTVPADRRSALSLRVRMSVAGEGAPKKPVLLMERKLEPGSLFRRPIRLEIIPVGNRAATKPPVTWRPADWHRHVTGFDQFQVTLAVGAEQFASKVFDLTGRLHDVTTDGRIKSAKDVGGGVRRGFGGLLGGGDDEPAKPKTRLESIVLEIELSRPGRAKLRQQRLLFGEPRRGVSPVYVADILVTPGPAGPLTSGWLALEAMGRNIPLLARLVASDDPKRFNDVGPVTRMPRILHQWQLARLALAQRMLTRQRSLTFLGGPAVAMWTTQLLVDERKKEITGRVAMDVVWDEQLLLPRAAGSADAAARGNVALGVASTVFESLLLRELQAPLMIRSALGESQLFQARGRRPVVSKPGRKAAFGKARPIPLAAWAITRNEPDRLLVFPRADSPQSWWSIHPATGATIGRGDGGEGQSYMEYLETVKMNLNNLKCFLEFQKRAFQGDSKEGAIRWGACLTGLDNPGGLFGGIGGGLKQFERFNAIGTVFAHIGNALTIGMFLEEDRP